MFGKMAGISTLEIDEKLKTVPNFLGAYAYDELPEKPTGDFSIIVNTEPGTEPGDHWIPIICQNNIVYFVDSFGRAPTNPLFSKEFKETIRTFISGYKRRWNNRMIQYIFSNVCGEYSIYFIREMQTKTMFDVLSIFGVDLRRNDSLVVEIVNSY